MGVITKRSNANGTVSYQAKCRRAGFPVVTKTFRELKDAKAFVNATERAFDLGEMPEGVKPAAAPSSAPAAVEQASAEFRTLADVLTSYRDEACPLQKAGHLATMKINIWLAEPFVQAPIADLKAALSKWRDARLKKVKPGTVLREMNLLYAAINRAREEKDAPIPDCKIKRPRTPAARTRRLRDGELELILKSAERSRSKPFKSAILLAIETGARASELIRMEWKHVDLEGKTAHLPMTKNGHPRTIPLSTRAVEVLAAMERNGERVLHGMTSTTLKRAWVTCRERADIEGLRFHDLRREAVSRMLEMGLNIVEVSQVSGHRSLQMLQVYARPTAESIAAKLG